MRLHTVSGHSGFQTAAFNPANRQSVQFGGFDDLFKWTGLSSVAAILPAKQVDAEDWLAYLSAPGPQNYQSQGDWTSNPVRINGTTYEIREAPFAQPDAPEAPGFHLGYLYTSQDGLIGTVYFPFPTEPASQDTHILAERTGVRNLAGIRVVRMTPHIGSGTVTVIAYQRDKQGRLKQAKSWTYNSGPDTRDLCLIPSRLLWELAKTVGYRRALNYVRPSR